MDNDLIRLGAQATLATRYAQEGREFVGQLAAMLEATLPGEVTVERRGGLFGPKTLSKLSVRLDEFTYALQLPKTGAPVASRAKVVRGVTLKTEELAMAGWLEEVGARLSEKARQHREISEALGKLTGG